MRLGFGLGVDVAAAGGAASGEVTSPPLAVTRPAAALAEFWNLWGDSTTGGVGAASGSSYPAQIRAGAAGVTGQPFHGGTGASEHGAAFDVVGNGGFGGQTTAQIAARVAGMKAGYPAEMDRPQVFSGGLNDFLPSVSPWPAPAGWPAAALTSLAANAGRVGAGKDWFVLPPPPENLLNVDGQEQSANILGYLRSLRATHGRRVINVARWLRAAVTPASGGMDERETEVNGGVPISLRAVPSALTDHAVLDAYPLTGAGAPTDLTQPEGRLYWDTAARKLHRKVGAAGTGSFPAMDLKHFNAAGYAAIARVVIDAMMASEGSGPPFVDAQEALVPADLPAGGTVAQLVWSGAATGFAITSDKAGATPDPRFAVSAAGLVTRTGAGALAEGAEELWVWSTNAHGTLRAPFDLYVDKPATATAPRRFAVASPGIVANARQDGALPSGRQLSFAMLVKIDDLASAPYLLNMVRGAGHADQSALSIQMPTAGRVRVTQANAAGANILSATAATGIAAATWTWVMVTLNWAAGTIQLFYNDAPVTIAGTLADADVPFATMNPLLYGAAAPFLLFDGANTIKGGIGPTLLFGGAVDWSVTATRRQLFGADGVPAARAPYAPVGGVTPHLDTSGQGLGAFLHGRTKADDPTKLVLPSYRARALVSVAG